MKNIRKISIYLFLLLLYSCKLNSEKNREVKTESSAANIQVQGHRGDRGNFPENTIPAFLSAVKKGVDVVELDVVISKDNKVVVSHEPYMSSLFVTTPAGDPISKKDERSYNMYEMTYDSIREYDTGSRGNPLFPEQEKMKTYKPLLSEVIDSVESFITAEGLQPLMYNIEIKSVEAEYGKFQPQPEEFVDLVMAVIKEKEIPKKIYLQSFDPKILNILNEKYPEFNIAYLVWKGGIQENLSLLNFKPQIYSPDFRLVKNEQFVDSIKFRGMKLIPWTVNDTKDIRKMIDLRVDGIITDYPERVIAFKKKT